MNRKNKKDNLHMFILLDKNKSESLNISKKENKSKLFDDFFYSKFNDNLKKIQLINSIFILGKM